MPRGWALKTYSNQISRRQVTPPAKRPLDAEDVVRLILDGTVVRVRLDKKAASISLLVVLGVRRDGQKVLLAVKNMGGESEAAWRALLDDLVGKLSVGPGS